MASPKVVSIKWFRINREKTGIEEMNIKSDTVFIDEAGYTKLLCFYPLYVSLEERDIILCTFTR